MTRTRGQRLGGMLLASVLLISPGLARADWLRAESEHFEVYGRSEKSLREFTTMLEDFDSLLRRLHGRPQDEVPYRKLPVYLTQNIKQLRRVWPGAKDDVAGVYFATPADVFVVAIPDGDAESDDQNRGDDTIFHEYVHHFMLQYYANAYPAWLIEGYAEYYMTADLANRRMVVGGVNSGRAYSLTLPGGWIDMSEVLTKRPSELRKESVLAFYAQSWLLTHYILSDPERKSRLKVYLDQIRNGGEPVAAWQKVYGDDMKGLTARLRAYLNRPLPAGMLPRQEALDVAMTITPLPASADDLLLANQRLKLRNEDGAPTGLLAEIRAVARAQPQDRFARLVAARAEIAYGERAVGLATLEDLVKANPADEEALVLLAETRLRTDDKDPAVQAANIDQARKLFARAFKLNPNNPITLHGYADARSATGPIDEGLVDIRLQTVMIAPQVGHFRLDAAHAAMAIKYPDTARLILRPLASDPHANRESEAAQALLKEIDAAEKKAP